MLKPVNARRVQAEKQAVRWPLALCAAALLCALSSFYALGARTAEVTARRRELPIYSVDRSDNKIAISFDAAWGGDKTEKILDILDEFGVKTTFFMVDIWTQRYPDLAREVVARGHDIGNHSATHPKMTTLSREKIIEELTVMSDNADEAVQWSVDSLDWKNQGVQPLIERATKNVKSGDIILFHNDSKYIVDALPTILKTYRERGFTIVPISQLLLSGETTIDAQGRQHPAPTTVPEV